MATLQVDVARHEFALDWMADFENFHKVGSRVGLRLSCMSWAACKAAFSGRADNGL